MTGQNSEIVRKPYRWFAMAIDNGYGIGVICGLLVSASALKATPILGWVPVDPMALLLAIGMGFALFLKPIFWPSLTAGTVMALFFACLSFGLIFASGGSKVIYVFVLAPILMYLGGATGQSKRGAVGFADGNIIIALSAGFAILLFSESFGLDGRVTVAGSNPIDITRALTFGLVCICLRILKGGQSKVVGATLVLMALFLTYCALQTGSRGPWAGLIVSLALMLMVSKYRIYFIGAALTISCVVIISWRLGVRGVLVDTPLFARLLNIGNVDDFSTGRDALSSIALEGIRQNPLGIGWGSFGDFVTARGHSRATYPHNIFLEIGVEAGLIGLVGFLVLIGAILIFTLKRLGSYRSLVGAVSFVYWLVASSFSSDFGGNRGLWVSAGLALGAFMVCRDRDWFPAVTSPVSHRAIRFSGERGRVIRDGGSPPVP